MWVFHLSQTVLFSHGLSCSWDLASSFHLCSLSAISTTAATGAALHMHLLLHWCNVVFSSQPLLPSLNLHARTFDVELWSSLSFFLLYQIWNWTICKFHLCFILYTWSQTQTGTVFFSILFSSLHLPQGFCSIHNFNLYPHFAGK